MCDIKIKVKEIKELRVVLEEDIKNLLISYENKTDVCVEHINILREFNTLGQTTPAVIYDIQTDLKIH